MDDATMVARGKQAGATREDGSRAPAERRLCVTCACRAHLGRPRLRPAMPVAASSLAVVSSQRAAVGSVRGTSIDELSCTSNRFHRWVDRPGHGLDCLNPGAYTRVLAATVSQHGSISSDSLIIQAASNTGDDLTITAEHACPALVFVDACVN